jgi:hypothetical protein
MRLRAYTLLLLCAFAFPVGIFSQQTYPQAAPSDVRDGAYAFTNATIWVDYKTKFDSATLVIRKGKIRGLQPKCRGTERRCCNGLLRQNHIPVLILDIYAAGYGLPAPKNRRGSSTTPAAEFSNKKGAYSWNEALKPEFSAG